MKRLNSLPQPIGPDRSMPDHWSLPTLLDVVRWRASAQPEEVAYTFLLDGEASTAELTFAELDQRARAIAAELLRRSQPGSRALVVLEPGLDYIAALYGCFYAGIVPAPVYPPDPFRIARTLPRLQAIFGSAQCELLLSTDAILGGPDGVLRSTCPSGAVAIEAIDADLGEQYDQVEVTRDGLALLQYTSGTTGEPRGVPITHANLVENLRGMERQLDVDDAIAVQWLPPYHDLGLIGGVFLPLFAGRHTVLMSPLSFMQNPARWLQAMSHYRATTSAAPNFGYELCLRKISDADCKGLDLSNWQVAASGAEPVRADTLDRFAERFAPYGFRREAFVPAYGMAETTLMVSVADIASPPRVIEIDSQALSQSRVEEQVGGRRIVGCGKPGPGVKVQIVDPQTCRLTAGVGEIWVRSGSVAAGYWQSPAATAERFDQTIVDTGERGYLRTGDLGFLRKGELFLVGRCKEMIILAGRNFYPHDIELAVQSADDAFKTDGGAALSVDVDNSEQLVLFQEVQRPRKQDLAKLLTTARGVVAEETGIEPYRVVLIPVGELPKTSSGKTRRAECWEQYQAGTLTVLAEWPSSETETAVGESEFEAPASETEQWLAEVWGKVLGEAVIGRADNFFALGGRSLQVTQMLIEVADRTGVVLPLKTLFDCPTLASLAEEIDRRAINTASPADNPSPATPVDLSVPQPLTPSQERFWVIEQLGVAGGANVPIALQVDGSIDTEQLQNALKQLVQRHDALRLRFVGDPAGVTQQLQTCQVPKIERLTVDEPVDSELLLEDMLARDWVWQPFDLSEPSLLRAAIVDTPAGDTILLLVLHHLVCDGVSIGILVDDLAALYSGQDLPPASPYATTLANHDDKQPAADDIAYWRDRLADVPAAIDLPRERTSQAATLADVAVSSEPLAAELAQRVEQLASELSATPFQVYLAVYLTTLARYSGQTEVGVGTPVAGRSGVSSSDTVGCFINTMPVFVDLSDTCDAGQGSEPNFAALVGQLRDRLLADLDHAQLPWEQIVEAANKPRQADRMPLVQTFFVHDDRTAVANAFGEAAVIDAATDYRGLATFDLTLVVETSRQSPRIKLIRDGRCLSPKVAELFLASYVRALKTISASPKSELAKLPIPAESEATKLRQGGEPTHYTRDESLVDVAGMIAGQVERTPQAVAVQCGNASQSFADLDTRSLRAARHLVSRGVGVGDRVGLLLLRTIDLPAVILGVWRAGAAYVPLDPDYPPARLAFMASDAELACVVADGDLIEQATAYNVPVVLQTKIVQAPAPDATLPEPAGLSGDRLAYVMYTSGSTGKPKGVMLPHRAVANLLDSFAQDTRLGPEHSMLGSTTFSFDISVLELFLPLVIGATLVLANSATAGDASRLTKLLADRPVTHLQGAPSTFRMLLAAGWRPTPQQTVLCGGEELTPDLAAKLLQTCSQVWNVYGPTETTIWSTLQRLESGEAPIPIGQPIANTQCYVLDKQHRLAPVGVWGELAIAGAGVADGYWNRPELTAERFPPNPFAQDANARMYLTGDQARWVFANDNSDGLILEFGGRGDGQVKVRGHRIELREIEIALNDHKAIGESAVIATEANSDGAALLAYVAAANGTPWTPAELREHLANRLPSYMTPSAFIAIDQMPRTDNGKIDRNRLPRDAGDAAARSQPTTAPRTPLETKLAEWVTQLLRIEQVGVYDNFFEIGGQSLLATQLVVRMRDELGVEPPLRDVYQRPTIADWAELIMQQELSAGDCVTPELLDELDQMSDDEAAAFLQSLADDASPPAVEP